MESEVKKWDFSSLTANAPKSKKAPAEKAAKADPADLFRSAVDALPDELKDSEFLKQYVKHRIVAKVKRENAKAEREAGQRIMQKAKDVKDAAELVGAFRSKDFIIQVYQAVNGSYYREVIARPNLKIN